MNPEPAEIAPEAVAEETQGSREVAALPPPALPTAEVARVLDSISAEARKDILSYARSETDLRLKELDGRYRMIRTGQLLAFAVVLILMGASFGLIAMGHTVEGTILGSIDVVALVSAFLAVAGAQRKQQ